MVEMSGMSGIPISHENAMCCSAVCFLNIFAIKGGGTDNLFLTQAFVQ